MIDIERLHRHYDNKQGTAIKPRYSGATYKFCAELLIASEFYDEGETLYVPLTHKEMSSNFIHTLEKTGFDIYGDEFKLSMSMMNNIRLPHKVNIQIVFLQPGDPKHPFQYKEWGSLVNVDDEYIYTPEVGDLLFYAV